MSAHASRHDGMPEDLSLREKVTYTEFQRQGIACMGQVQPSFVVLPGLCTWYSELVLEE